jgi:DNA polymerase-3 subunit gamma/tau
VTVAKIAGKDSALLQISSDERARVARIAELFSEEELARHLQIMLRTHGELGYRQEQRFHLELGLLKMAHAQRLLPLEQLLSDLGPGTGAGASTSSARPRPGASVAASGETRHAQMPTPVSTQNKPNIVSPFAADSARKGNPRAETSGESAVADKPPSSPDRAPAFAEKTMTSADKSVRATQSGLANVTSINMGATALALEEQSPQPEWQANRSIQPAAKRESKLEISTADSPAVGAKSASAAGTSVELLRDAVLGALGNQRMLVSLLETAQWSLNGSSLLAKVDASSTMIEMSFTAEARRVGGAVASGAAGRPVKFSVEPGGVAQTAAPARPAPNGSARSRAENDPIVQRMQEKFNAEIRTVIDYRQKG